MSPTIYEGKLFIGASSLEEAFVLSSNYKCCNFVGNMVSLSFFRSSASTTANKFTVNWNLTTIPLSWASKGWAGGSLWGIQPSIDVERGRLFIATGNSYSVPQIITDCQTATQNISAVVEGLVPDPCLPRDVWQESVLAVDIELGIVNWITQISALDAVRMPLSSEKGIS